ncbi:helix-turn-helix domain-containing protein [Streptomyces sp. QL37]|uniref:helix-turn-helix domain-containing protein n=1 Tax=Streptomyces sp. QL37 TaxID=2093747 RepID=UPI00137518DE|nr:helix-turn-helix domain-containing protein [Streptomyces sp. QL37]
MNDDAVETQNATQHTTWRDFQNDLHSLMAQAGIQQQQIARSVGVSPSTVGRWLKKATPLDWPRVEQFVRHCLEHADAQGRDLTPGTLTDLARWKARLESIGTTPYTEESTHPPEDPKQLHLVTPEPQRLRPNITMVVSPAAATFAVILIGVVATVTVFTFSGPSSAPGTSTPATTSSAPMDRPVAERFDDELKADRGAPRPTLSPTPEAPTPDSDPTRAATCSNAALPAALERLAPLIIGCTSTSVSVLTCPPRLERPPSDQPSDPPCFLLELSSTHAMTPKQ